MGATTRLGTKACLALLFALSSSWQPAFAIGAPPAPDKKGPFLSGAGGAPIAKAGCQLELSAKRSARQALVPSRVVAPMIDSPYRRRDLRSILSRAGAACQSSSAFRCGFGA